MKIGRYESRKVGEDGRGGGLISTIHCIIPVKVVYLQSQGNFYCKEREERDIEISKSMN